LSFIYPIYKHNWRNISTIYIYITRVYRLRHTELILPVGLYRCETWSFTLREDHRLRVFENRVLKRTFGPKRHEVTGEGVEKTTQ
jgi:hypothetical protein